jgi:hypothetical protein
MTSSGANSPSLLQATARATKLANMAKVKKDSLIVVSCLLKDFTADVSLYAEVF